MKTGMIFGLALVALVGAVAVAVENGGFSTLLSSIAPGSSADRSQTRISSATPSPQPEVTQPGAIEPVPAPPAAQLPAPTPPAQVANGSTSSAKTAPVLDKAGTVPSAQAGGRVTAADILVPDENGTGRTALTAQEKDAIARGLKELGLTATSATPSPQSQQAVTAELNRKALADAEAARSKQLQAQNKQ
jgi:hypothetical protein